MAISIHIPQITPLTLFYLLLLSSPTLAINITALLSSFPDLSSFASLISSTTISADVFQRTSVTLLAVPNSYLSSTSDLLTRHHLSPTNLPDVLRYHVLLQYLTWSDLHQIPPSGTLVTTLFQTTGRATSNSGSVNITFNPSNGVVSIHSPGPYSSPSQSSNATVLSLIKTLPYNITIFTVDSLLIPYNFDLTASETRPPLGLNITKALIDGHNFNVAASMLSASGVVQEFEADEGGAGITLFVPTDEAFADLPSTVKLQSLPADKKAVVLKFHVLHSYYPLGSLESIVNPVQPTLATEAIGAGRFTLNISRVNGSVAIDSGIVQGSVTQTVCDQNPVAIFGVSKVLLPKEFFGKNPAMKPGNTGTPITEAQPPDMSLSPENPPELNGRPSHLSSPPGFRQESRSGSPVIDGGVRSSLLALCCIGLYLGV
ncbi:fasciclin-like arabinogalactan protein 4 [Quercus lobata]|uniref:FAS1 domain-containing protein n=1 Tax=Quercus lobata TaxID=97700 RepID=A0A7N2KP94_QUELO|nr:fasciclin-like arabinogalactan protein 4 [Quercus lobata]